MRLTEVIDLARRKSKTNSSTFSDSVFELLTLFNNGQLSSGHWVDTINKIVL